MRLRRQVAFDRLLARLFAQPDAPWMLKGGYTLELRLGGRAGATKDLDLSVPDLHRLAASDAEPLTPSVIIRKRLQEWAASDLGDGFAFRIGAPMADLNAAPYGGARYPVEARLDHRTFVTFHLDVGIGDVVIAAPEWLTGQDLLGFAGIPPARVAALARAQQFAENFHAYTLRGERANTHVKDWVNLTLLIDLGLPDTATLKQAIHATFARCGTHAEPVDPAPPRLAPRSRRRRHRRRRLCAKKVTRTGVPCLSLMDAATQAGSSAVATERRRTEQLDARNDLPELWRRQRRPVSRPI